MESTKWTMNQRTVIISALGALWWEIRPNMRCISVNYLPDSQKVIWSFFYDTQPPEEDLDYDVEGTITTEMISDFPELTDLEELSFITPLPQEIISNGIGIYCRYEEKSLFMDAENHCSCNLARSIFNFKKHLINYNQTSEINEGNIRISAHAALWGEIRPNVRRVYVDYNKNKEKIILHFIYNDQGDLQDCKNNFEATVVSRMQADFPGVQVEGRSSIIPIPEYISSAGMGIFARHEISPDSDGG